MGPLNLRIKDTIDRVSANLELTGPDAAVYVHLCTSGPAKVSDLADALHIHRNEVYRTTERLVQRGLAQATMERPARFVAVSPDQVFDTEIQRRLSTIDDLRKSRTEVMALVEQLHSLTPAPPKGIYKIIQGRPAIYAQRDQMIANARDRIDWVSSHIAMIQHADVTGTLELAQKRAGEGIDLRFLVRTTNETAPRLDDLRRMESVQAREFLCEVPVRFLIVDDNELLMWVVDDPSDSLYAGEEVAMYTTAPGFVTAQQQFLATAWERAPGVASH